MVVIVHMFYFREHCNTTRQTGAANALIALLLAGNPGGNDQLIREPHQLSSCQWQGIPLRSHNSSVPVSIVVCPTLHQTVWVKSLECVPSCCHGIGKVVFQHSFGHVVVWPGILAAGSNMDEGLQIADVAVKTAASNCRCMCEVQHPKCRR